MLKVASILNPDTLQVVYKVFAWSVKALSTGTFPGADHNDVKSSKDHHPERFAKVGHDLAGGLCGAYAEMRGDWKYLKEALYLK